MASVPEHFTHYAAVDWSGAMGERQKGIAVAICARGSGAPALVTGPAGHWSRAEVLAWLREAMPPETLVGFDLGPSLPFADCGAFFPGWAESPDDARGLWALVDRLCAEDPHLAVSSFVDHAEASRHFRRHGQRTGDRFPPGAGRFRVTEEAQRRQGLNPYSNLNLVGAAQVGKSSLSGMRLLHRVQHHLPVWPFDDPPARGALIVEIYTSIAALAAGRRVGRTKMKTIEELNDALMHAEIGSAPIAGAGRIDDHSSDALLTAAWLRAVAHRPQLWHPQGLTGRIARTEGWTFGVE